MEVETRISLTHQSNLKIEELKEIKKVKMINIAQFAIHYF